MKSCRFEAPRRKSRKGNNRPTPSARPRLEVLEGRVVPALINHGGAILPSVQAQAVYLGTGWSASTIPPSNFDGFLSTTVNSTATTPEPPYLAMLHNAGFTGVTGAGGSLAGVTDNVTVPTTITDAQIRTDLAAAIQAKIQNAAGVPLQQPNANTLYFVFVQPKVVVDLGNGETSTNTFLAYHGSFTANGNTIRYAVIPFHGTGGNAQDPFLNSAFDSMTDAASHEMAEAITDPDAATWFDRSGNEVGDIVNGVTVYLNGYAVQREAAIPGSTANFLAMTPAGATASHDVTFSVTVAGELNVGEASGSSFVAANPSGETGHVLSVSTQGIDDFGQPMTDVLFSDGNAYEYHDFLSSTATTTGNPKFLPWTSLGANIEQAVAAQGVSYVLFTNGNLGEFVDPNYTTLSYGYGINPGSRRGVIASNVTGITAVGTDQVAVNAVEYTVKGSNTVHEWRDVTGQSSTPSGFQAASFDAEVGGFFAQQVADQNGNTLVLATRASGSVPSGTSEFGALATSLGTPATMLSNRVFQTIGPGAFASPRLAEAVQALSARPDLGGAGEQDVGVFDGPTVMDDADLAPFRFDDLER